MKLESRAVADLKPYQRNPRVNRDAVDAVARSITDFGWRVPIVITPEGEIVAGHTRLMAAQKLGLEKVPVHVAHDLTPEQVKAYRLADNRTAEIASWDKELLAIELGELAALDIDLTSLGFDQDELAKLLGGDVADGLTNPDSVPAPPDEATTQPGDLWILGDHRLLCGDSAKAEDVDRLLAGQPIHLVNTDPPYNVRLMYRTAA